MGLVNSNILHFKVERLCKTNANRKCNIYFPIERNVVQNVHPFSRINKHMLETILTFFFCVGCCLKLRMFESLSGISGCNVKEKSYIYIAENCLSSAAKRNNENGSQYCIFHRPSIFSIKFDIYHLFVLL